MPKELNLRFGRQIRTHREQKGWSQEDLAEFANLSRAYVGEIERGQVSPSIFTAYKLAVALNTTMHALLPQAPQFLP